MNIVLPHWVRRGLLGAFVVFTCLDAMLVAFIDPTAGPATVVGVGAFAVGVVAGLGRPGDALPAWRAGVVLLVALALPWLAASTLDPHDGTFGSGAWYLSGVGCLAVQLLLGRRVAFATVGIAGLWVQTIVWAGPEGLIRFFVVGLTLVLGLMLAAGRAVASAVDELRKASATRRTAAEWRAAQDAYQNQRESRLQNTETLAADMLDRIAAGDLTAADKAECLVLHQTIRDEIRGRRLLNDAMREQVIAHRRRGAFVQLMDDGGLDDVPQHLLDPMLDSIAAALGGVRSDRIVVRTMPPDSPKAVSVVATTSDPVAAALGLEEDEDQVDLWLELDRPMAVPA